MILSFILSVILSLLLITTLNFILNKTSKSSKNKIPWQHYLFGYLFILYLVLSLKEVVGFPSLSEFQRLLQLNEPLFNPTLNLIPFSDGVEISSILNIIFFMPLGFLLATLWKKCRRLLPTLCFGISFSFIIELGQLFTKHRASDINDLIMNTIGTVLGWLIFIIISKFFYKLANKTIINDSSNDNLIIKLEPYIYIIIALISVFLT